MSNVKKRALSLDILKLISCFGVIIIHVSGHGLRDIPSGSVSWYFAVFWDSTARFAVPVFLMCTGAVMLRTDRELSVKRVYTHYFWRILRTLLFWSWAYYMFTILGQYFLTGWFEPNGFINALTETLRFNHHLHLYYLQMLLLFYIALPALRVFVRSASESEFQYALIIWFALGIALPLLRKYPPVNIMHGVISYYEINFVWSAIGYTLLGYGLHSGKLTTKSAKHYALTFIFGLVFTFSMTAYLCLKTGSVNTDFMEGMSPGPALMAYGIFGYMKSRFSECDTQSKPLKTLVDASFCIYLVHHFFVMVFRQIGFSVANYHAAYQVPLVTCIVFALSFVAWQVLKRIPIVKDYLI